MEIPKNSLLLAMLVLIFEGKDVVAEKQIYHSI